MLRVSQTPDESLRVEGRLVGPWVELLRSACRTALDSGRTLQLDLSGLKFADADGAALLQQLQESGIFLTGLSPLIASFLKQDRT